MSEGAPSQLDERNLNVPYGVIAVCASVGLAIAVGAGVLLSAFDLVQYAILQRLAALQSVLDSVVWGMAVISLIVEKGQGRRLAVIALAVWAVSEIVVLGVGQAQISVGTYW